MLNTKFFKSTDQTVSSLSNIVWNEEHGVYCPSEEGRLVGLIKTNDLDLIVNYRASKNINLFIPFLPKEIELEHIVIDFPYYNHMEADGFYVFEVHDKRAFNEMPPDVYTFFFHDRVGVASKKYFYSIMDKNLIGNKNLSELVLNFFQQKNSLRKNKKGILLYGPPGNGKTTSIMQLFPLAQKEEIYIFIVDSGVNIRSLNSIRKAMNGKKVIFILEEMTERLIGRESVADILTFVDGEHSWDNSIVIATTNYPEELPANIVDRPGRLDTFIEYCNPTDQEIDEIAKRFGIQESEAQTLYDRNLSFDYVSFIMDQAKIHGVSCQSILEREEEKRKFLSKTFKADKRMGF